jgi:hypothetical protein
LERLNKIIGSIQYSFLWSNRMSRSGNILESGGVNFFFSDTVHVVSLCQGDVSEVLGGARVDSQDHTNVGGREATVDPDTDMVWRSIGFV